MTDEMKPHPDDPILPEDNQDDAPPAPDDDGAADDVLLAEIAEDAAEADALDDAVEAEIAADALPESAADEDEAYDDEAYDDDEYYDEDEAYEDAPDTSVDWAALAASGAAAGHGDVPDLTLATADAMEVDIDAALAAVDTLGAVVAAEQARKREEADRREAQRRADEEYRKWAESYVFRRPGMIRVQGGRVVTILPAVALMAVGAVLTLATTSGQALSLSALAAAASAGISVSLLSYWLASGRWARGALFAALLVAIAGAWTFILSLPDVNLPWTVPFAAGGAAFALTGLLGRPRTLSWILVGLGVIAGVLILPALSQPTLINAAPFVLGVAAVLALLPIVLRTRRG